MGRQRGHEQARGDENPGEPRTHDEGQAYASKKKFVVVSIGPRAADSLEPSPDSDGPARRVSSGLSSFLGVIPLSQPSTPLPEGAAAFTAAIMKAGYMFPLVKGTECLVGALLLSNRFVPLALALIAPVVVNIVAFHAFLEPSGLGLAAVVMGLEVYLAWSYRRAYRPMFEMRP